MKKPVPPIDEATSVFLPSSIPTISFNAFSITGFGIFNGNLPLSWALIMVKYSS